MYYILEIDGKTPREVSMEEYMAWNFVNDREYFRVGDDLVSTSHGQVRVSTVYLGIDHSIHAPPPVLWETMIFFTASENREPPEDSPLLDYQERYVCYEAAVEGHQRAVAFSEQN